MKPLHARELKELSKTPINHHTTKQQVPKTVEPVIIQKPVNRRLAHGKYAPEVEAGVMMLKEEGLSNREAGRLSDVSEFTVRQMIKQNSGFGQVSQMLKAAGVAASKAGLMGIQKVSDKINDGNCRLGEMAIATGIMLQRGRELLDRPEPVELPSDWGDIGTDLVQEIEKNTAATNDID